MVNGKTQFITLGKHPMLKLKDAKQMASRLLNEVITNKTVSQLTKKYWNDIAEPHSKVPNQVKGYLNHIESELGGRKVVDKRPFC